MKMHVRFQLVMRQVLLFTLILLLGKSMESQTPQYSFLGGGNISNTIPFASAASGNNKRQWVFYPSNFTGAPAGYITTVYVRASTTVSPNFTGFLIRMGTTTLSTLVAGPFVTNLDTVLYASTINLTTTTNNWIAMTLTTPWFYDASSNFIVEASHQGYSPGFSVLQSTFTGRSLYGNSGSATGSSQDRLADFGFNMVPGTTDVGLEGFASFPDTLCEGSKPVVVVLKNHGPNPLATATINWKVNSVLQPVYTWSGSLATNASTNVTLGNYTFMQGTSYNLEAFVSSPNGAVDTINSNDTIYKTGITVMPAPSITLTDTAKVICQGDSVTIGGILTGSPPWNLVISDGTVNLPVSNITSSTFSISFTPTTTKTYTIVSIMDATGCENTSGPHVTVTVQAAPGATITPMGSTAACSGDSVTLMATIGLNFTYQWYKDGVILPGATNYVLNALSGGAYTVKVTSPIGCSSTSAPLNIVIHPLPVVFLGNDTNLAPGAHITLDAGPGFNSYNWSTGATSQTLYVDTAGHGLGIQTIWVAVQDNNYCTGRDTIKVNFVHNPGIAEGYTDVTVQIIPNPTDGKFELHLAGFRKGYLMVRLYGHDGKLVYEKNYMLKLDTEWITIDPGYMSEGVYLLTVTGKEGSLSRKLIIR